MRPFFRLLGWWLALCFVAGCTGPRGFEGWPSPGRELAFDGPGWLAVIFERSADAARERTLVVYSEASRRVMPGVQPERARWLSTRELLLMLPETRSASSRLGPARLSESAIWLMDLGGRVFARIGTARALYDAEPSPDGAFFALRVGADARGESSLEIWSLRGDTGRLAQLRRALEAPRWSPDGARLVAAERRQDLEPDSDSAGFASVALPFPRLVLFQPSLLGPVVPLADGPNAGRDVAGGSFPLWWDHDGIWARQRGGLVRCDAERGGCVPVYRLPAGAVIVGGRRTGDAAALLLVRRGGRTSGRLANELYRVDLVAGTGTVLWRAPAGLAIVDLHWVADQDD